MPFNLSSAINSAVNCKTENESSFSSANVALLTAAANVATTTEIISKVTTYSLLPPASENKGRFIYVEDENTHYFSNGITWSTDFRSTLLSRNIWTWGCNGYGVLGDGTSIDRCSPVTTSGGGTNWCRVSGGTQFVGAIKTDGTLWAWGRNSSGRLGDGSTTNRSSPVTTSGGGTTWCQVSAGANHATAIKTDGTLWTWGSNGQGALGTNNTTSRSSPGTTIDGATTWCQVSAGNSVTSGIKIDGTLWTWGCNSSGRLGDGTTIDRSSPVTTAGGGTDWCQVSTKQETVAAVKTDGTLWTWGCNNTGQLGDGSTISRSSPGTTAGAGTNWCQVASSINFMAAVKTDGTLWTWGCAGSGALGDGTTINRSSPGTTAGAGTNWCHVGRGAYRAVGAIKTDGTLWTWGYGRCGQTADGTASFRSSPATTVGNISNWSQVDGSGTSMAGVTFFVRQGF
jgi:alpha-tubulin suppressor-like RCC1 family protein